MLDVWRSFFLFSFFDGRQKFNKWLCSLIINITLIRADRNVVMSVLLLKNEWILINSLKIKCSMDRGTQKFCGGACFLDKKYFFSWHSYEILTIILRESHFSSLRLIGLCIKTYHEKKNILHTKACGRQVFFFYVLYQEKAGLGFYKSINLTKKHI